MRGLINTNILKVNCTFQLFFTYELENAYLYINCMCLRTDCRSIRVKVN